MTDEPEEQQSTPRNWADSLARGEPKAPHHIWKPAFLAEYSKCGVKATAARAAGVSRSGVLWAEDHDPVFAAAVLEAEQEAMDALEQEARRRAIEGVEEPVFYKGEECGAKQNYSDDLMKFLLERKRYPRSLTVNTGDSVESVAASIAKAVHAMKGSVPGVTS